MVLKKAEITKEKILSAAKKVFSRHSYNAASIRMIGKEGEFDHGIIRYHFASKAELFEALLKKNCDEFYKKHLTWLDALETKSPETGLSLYLDRCLDYNFTHPESIRIFMKNISQTDEPESIPGYYYIPEVLSKIRKAFESQIPLNASESEISMFIDSFNIMIINYIGASSCQAHTLRVKADSDVYRKWVKNTMMFIFLPHLKKLIFSK